MNDRIEILKYAAANGGMIKRLPGGIWGGRFKEKVIFNLCNDELLKFGLKDGYAIASLTDRGRERLKRKTLPHPKAVMDAIEYLKSTGGKLVRQERWIWFWNDDGLPLIYPPTVDYMIRKGIVRVTKTGFKDYPRTPSEIELVNQGMPG